MDESKNGRGSSLYATFVQTKEFDDDEDDKPFIVKKGCSKPVFILRCIISLDDIHKENSTFILGFIISKRILIYCVVRNVLSIDKWKFDDQSNPYLSGISLLSY